MVKYDKKRRAYIAPFKISVYSSLRYDPTVVYGPRTVTVIVNVELIR